MVKSALVLSAMLGLSISLPVAWGQDADVSPSLPSEPPLPSARPEAPDEAVPERSPSSVGIPPEEQACRHRLRELGVTFTEHEPIDEPAGCSARWPLSVTGLPGGVTLEPAAVLTCPMAEATARFVGTTAAPLSRAIFGSELETVAQVSSYVCRERADGGKLSEHAFANALDWGALLLEDGTRIDVREYRRQSDPKQARLIDALRKAACGPFRTVLGPGSDADHADHFHFDLAERRNGGTWCR